MNFKEFKKLKKEDPFQVYSQNASRPVTSVMLSKAKHLCGGILRFAQDDGAAVKYDGAAVKYDGATVQQNSEAGFSLVSTLIGIFVLGLVAVLASTQFGQMSNMQRHLKLDGDREAARRAFADSVDCMQSFGPQSGLTCTNFGANPTLRDKSGAILVNGSGNATKAGNWYFRAVCDSTNNELNIEAANATGQVAVTTANTDARFVTDPATKQKLHWNHLKSRVFPPGAGLCKSWFTAPVAAFCPAPGTIRNYRCQQFESLRHFDPGTGLLCCVTDIMEFVWIHVDTYLRPYYAPCTSANFHYPQTWSAACGIAATMACQAHGFHGGYIQEGDAYYGVVTVTCVQRSY